MTQNRIKALSENITKNKFEYRLIKRNEDTAIYSQHNKIGIILAYETFKIKKGLPHPKAIEDIKNYDLVERFPNNEDFGKTAWSYRNLQDAEKAFIVK